MASSSKSPMAHSLSDLLSKGLTVVEPRQGYKARNKVTCICTVDIDNDGDVEIIFGSADGRLTMLSKECEVRWHRVVEDKSPVTTIAVLPYKASTRPALLIVAGTERGYIYVFNKYGQAFKPDGTCNPFSEDSIEKEERESYWFACEQAINQISVTLGKDPCIIFSSEDSQVYALSGSNGKQLWSPFQTCRWARCVFACDLNGDKHIEVLASTTNRYLYQLDHYGHQITKKKMEHSVRALLAVDIDRDGTIEILMTTDKGDLIALRPDFELLWSVSPFANRVRALYVTDIDRDGENEIIAGGDDKHLYILNARGEVLWRHFLGARIVSISAGDIDEDGVQEVIVGADDERVHVLHLDLARPREGLYEQIQQVYQAQITNSKIVPEQLIPSERELLRDITYNGREEPIDLEQAEKPYNQGRFKEALIAFLRLEEQKVLVQWQDETRYEAKLLSLESMLGDLIIGTIDGAIRAYSAEGELLWSCQLPDQILSAQVGRIQSPGQEDILICSTDRQVYLVGYLSGNTQDKKNVSPQILHSYPIDPMISSVSLKPGLRNRNPEIVFGSESQKIYIYRNGLDQLPEYISTNQNVHLVQLYLSKPRQKHAPDIIAAMADHHVVAYSDTSEKALWTFKAWNRIRAISVEDIDGDNRNEIIIGSEDRNVHVLNDQGHFKWRYYFPYSVLSIHVVDIDQDGYSEVLAGCADGYLYVLDKEGELLWKYQIDERITAITSRKSEDAIEIALGTESRVEVLRVLDPDYFQDSINQCWQNLVYGKSEESVLKGLLETTEEPVLQAFALQKAATVLTCNHDKQELFKKFARNNAVVVRKAVISGLMTCYSSDPIGMRQLLDQLSTDREQAVRLTLVAHIDQLIRYNWVVGFDYLARFAENVDRFVRRAVMRKLCSMIDEVDKSSWQEGYWQLIFNLLLVGVCDQKYTWVRQEAARALAHFLEQRPWEILCAIHRFLTRDVQPDILLHMAHHVTKQQTICTTLEVLVQLLEDDLNVENATTRLELAVQTLARIEDSKFGEDTLLLFKELHSLFSLQTLQDIAQYQYHFRDYQPQSENRHFMTTRRVFEAIPNVIRILKVYLHRQHINDRITSLQEACRAIDRLRHFMYSEYHTAMPGVALVKSPDYKFFDLLFQHWLEIVQSILDELRGKPEVKATLLTSELYYEQVVSVLLEIQNVGRSPAYGVRVALLHSEDFSVVRPLVEQTEILFWNEKLQVEFTIQFKAYTECVDLQLEIIFDDGENGFLKEISTKHLILRTMESSGEYEFIPNPYSTGTPVNDNDMFFGREYDIEVLKRELTLHKAQRIIVLHGLRRSGKTSLLRYMVKNDVLDNCIPIYIDMQKIIHEATTARIFFKIAFQIRSTIVKKLQLKLAMLEIAAFKEDGSFAFDRFLDEVEAGLQDRLRLVLLVDEFEILDQMAEQGLLAPTFFAYLRSLMQERNINFLLAGAHKIEQLTREYWSVFYGFVLPHRLSKISPEGARKLITLPVEQQLTYDPFVIDRIRQLTGDQPFLLNGFCRILVDHCNELRKTHVSLYDVTALLTYAVKFIGLQFDGLWQQLSLEEQCALAVIAWGGRDRALTYAEIEGVYSAERISYDQQRLRDALGSLAQQDLLESLIEEEERDNLRYRISIGLLKFWLNQESMLTLLKQKRSRHTT